MKAMKQCVEELFIEPIIDMNKLKSLVYSGKLEVNSSVRAKAWQLLLGYLPPNQLLWGDVIKQKEQQYKININQLLPSIVGNSDFLNEEIKTEEDECSTPSIESESISPPVTFTHSSKSSICSSPRSSSQSFDVPLNDGVFAFPERSKSAMKFSPKEFFGSIIRTRSNSLGIKKINEAEQNRLKIQLRTINNDIPRTAMLLKFNDNDIYDHQKALKRILYSLLCIDKIKYTQGMNEVATVFYYVFSYSSSIQNYESAEIISYYCMKGLLSEYSHYFNENEDNKPEGISTAMNEVMKLLKEEDIELFENLQSKGIENALYLLRWMSLMMAEELPIDSLVLLWDRLLSNLKSKTYLMYFCVSMLLSLKEEIMSSGFCTTLKMLQHFPERNFNDLDMFAKYMMKFPKKLRQQNITDRTQSPLSVFMTCRLPKRACSTPTGLIRKSPLHN